MQVLVRFMCVCSKNIPAMCRLCHGKGYVDRWTPLYRLKDYPRPWLILQRRLESTDRQTPSTSQTKQKY
jgi:hypothetical protein